MKLIYRCSYKELSTLQLPHECTTSRTYMLAILLRGDKSLLAVALSCSCTESQTKRLKHKQTSRMHWHLQGDSNVFCCAHGGNGTGGRDPNLLHSTCGRTLLLCFLCTAFLHPPDVATDSTPQTMRKLTYKPRSLRIASAGS